MNRIFADTAGWGHLLDASQAYHREATMIYRNTRQQNCRFITTNYVIAELAALLNSPLHIPKVTIVKLLMDLKKSPWIEIFHVDSETDEKAWQLFSQRLDKDWSLVDCSSFIIMGPVNFPVIAYEFAANCNCSEALAASMGNQKCFHW